MRFNLTVLLLMHVRLLSFFTPAVVSVTQAVVKDLVALVAFCFQKLRGEMDAKRERGECINQSA